MLQSKCHLIATMRSKIQHIQDIENGQGVIKKVSVSPVQREGIEHEFTVFWEFDHKHMATASKDRTGLFDGQVLKPSVEIGGRLAKWLANER